MFPVSDSIAHRYGRKAGLVRHHLGMTRYRLGMLSSFERIRWNSVARLVFVCSGNICRSAYGEARAKTLSVPATSFGLNVREENAANQTAVRIAAARGVNLSAHRTRSADAVTLMANDLVLAMETPQARLLVSRPLPAGMQVTLLGLWCTPPHPHIEDPYGLSVEYFSTCFELIDDAVNRIARRMARGSS